MTNLLFALSFRTFQFVIILFLLCASVSAESMFKKVMDFDGDGMADFAVVRNQNGSMIWHIYQSSAGYKVQKWGLYSDYPVAADYDGDGKTDLAVYRRNFNTSTFIGQYTFYILRSQTNTLDGVTFQDYSFHFDSPTHQDYDGDGKTDPGTYYGEYGMTLPMQLRLSTGGVVGFTVPSGNGLARIGDIDGDGRAELAFLNDYTKILTLRNIDFSNPRSVDVSALGGFLIPADLDGDGKGDLVVWRSSEGSWFWIRSSDGVFQKARFGLPGDTPVPADYDGDGKTDLAIWRPGPQSYYWVRGSKSGLRIFAWGTGDDRVLRY